MNNPQTLDFSAVSSLIIASKYLWQLVFTSCHFYMVQFMRKIIHDMCSSFYIFHNLSSQAHVDT